MLASVDQAPVVAIGALVAFALVAVAAPRILPPALVAPRATPDLFLIVPVAVGPLLASPGAVMFEVPMALAAFVAGLTLADTPEAAEARRRLLPFRDPFEALLLVAVGSLVDPARLLAAPPTMALLIGPVSWSRRSASPLRSCGWGGLGRVRSRSPWGSAGWVSPATCGLGSG